MLNYIIWILAVILYSPIFYRLYRARWEKIDYTHAYFILPISIWLVWRKRQILRALFKQAQIKYSFFSLILLISGILMFIFGWRQDYLFISTLSLVPVLYGLISYVYGLNLAKTISFPLFYLLLLVPPPIGILDSITLPMRYGVSVLTELILKSLHYPITREGLLLSIGEHEIFMGQPCSGFRSLITMFSLGLVYVYITKTNLTRKSSSAITPKCDFQWLGKHFILSYTIKKIILVTSIVPLTLLGNLIRIIILCLITFYFGEAIGQGFFHYFSGIVIFVTMLLGLLGLEYLLK